MGGEHGPRRRSGLDEFRSLVAAGRYDSMFVRSAARLQEWVDAHGVPWVSFSGGKDSVATALLLERVVGPDNVRVVLFDSGLEFPETLGYCRDLAGARGWVFDVIPAVPSALEHLVASGLWDVNVPNNPKPFGCSMHELLIERPAAVAEGRFGPVMAWGLRSQESKTRRMLLGKHQGVFTTVNGVTRMGPVWDWSAVQVVSFVASCGVGLCPVYGRLESLGVPPEEARLSTMVDATAMGFGRFTWLRRGWPVEWARLCEALPRLHESG